MQYISQVNYLSIEGVVIKEGRSSGDADASPHHSRMTVKAGTRAAVCLLLQEACRSRRRSTGLEGRPAGSAEAQAKVADCRPTLLLADRATLGLARG